MYDKSKVALLNYVKEKEDEMKALNTRFYLLREATRMNTEDIKQISERYAHAHWDNNSLENDIKNIKLDYSRMERKLKTANTMVYIQPFIWSACWFFMHWLLRG